MSDDFMGGGGGKSVPLDNVGDSVTGIVIGPPDKRPSLDDDGNPRTWPSGDIRFVWVVPIATDLRDPDDPFDEGERALWLKWKSLEAVQKAIRAAGAKTIEVGGQITLTLVGFGPKASPKHNPPKLYSAVYVPAPSGFMGQEEASSPPARPSTPPPAPGSSAPAAGTGSPRQSILDRLGGQHARNAAARGAAHHSDGEPPF